MSMLKAITHGLGAAGRGIGSAAATGLQDLSNAITPPPPPATASASQVSQQVQDLLSSHAPHAEGMQYPTGAGLTMNGDGSHSLPNIHDEMIPDPKTGAMTKNPSYVPQWQFEDKVDEKGKPVLDKDGNPTPDTTRVKLDAQGQPVPNPVYEHMSGIHDQWSALNDAIQRSMQEAGGKYQEAGQAMQTGYPQLASQMAASAPAMPQRSAASRFAIALGTQNPNTLDTLHQPNPGLALARQTDLTDFEQHRQKDQQLNALKEHALNGQIQSLLQQGKFKEALAASTEMKQLMMEQRNQLWYSHNDMTSGQQDRRIGMSNQNIIDRMGLTHAWDSAKISKTERDKRVAAVLADVNKQNTKRMLVFNGTDLSPEEQDDIVRQHLAAYARVDSMAAAPKVAPRGKAPAAGATAAPAAPASPAAPSGTFPPPRPGYIRMWDSNHVRHDVLKENRARAEAAGLTIPK